MGGVYDFGGADVEPDAYDQAIADAEAALVDLKAKREEARKPKIPQEPRGWGTVIRQPSKVPAFRKAAGRWFYVTTSEPYSWEGLMRSGGTEFEVMYGG